MAAPEPVQSWGRLGAPIHTVCRPAGIAQARVLVADGAPYLAHGLGRSYGDVALNAGGRLIATEGLDRFRFFDRRTGLIAAEAGVTLEDLIAVALPHGWFLPTTPGTKYVTLGGAIANDVHGKNHHANGTFGSWVREIELARSDGSLTRCSAGDNAALFAATIGGMGLTGLITAATLQLVRVGSAFLDAEDIAFTDLDGFLELADRSDAEGWEHTVGWMDCVGSRAGRGIFSRANWADDGDFSWNRKGRIAIPFQAPEFILNRVSIGAFNELYYRAKAMRRGRTRQPFEAAFYPLDGIRHWNRLYGPRGFYQYQCVIPRQAPRAAMKDLLGEIARSGQASFLVVIKTFGDKPSPGLVSYPMPGINLALDFPNRGARTHALLARLDRIVADNGGRIYPAKDARMPASLFRAGYPRWQELAALKDPAARSDFWTRVGEE